MSILFYIQNIKIYKKSFYQLCSRFGIWQWENCKFFIFKDESKNVENDALSLFDNIDNNGDKKISKKEWKLYIDEQQPKFIKDKTIFSSIDKNKNKKISKREFITFFKRLKK